VIARTVGVSHPSLYRRPGLVPPGQHKESGTDATGLLYVIERSEFWFRCSRS